MRLQILLQSDFFTTCVHNFPLHVCFPCSVLSQEVKGEDALPQESGLLLCSWGREGTSSLPLGGHQKDISAYEHRSTITERVSLGCNHTYLCRAFS